MHLDGIPKKENAKNTISVQLVYSSKIHWGETQCVGLTPMYFEVVN
jgi:hypothetical protein